MSSASIAEERLSAENGDIDVCSVQSFGAVKTERSGVSKHAGHCEEKERKALKRRRKEACRMK